MVSNAANIGDSRQPTGQTFQVECKVLILAAGAMGTSVAGLLEIERRDGVGLLGRGGPHGHHGDGHGRQG